MALWFRDDRHRDAVIRALREEIGVDDLAARQSYTSPKDRADRYLSVVTRMLDSDSLVEEDDELVPNSPGLYADESGTVWSLDENGWAKLGYAGDNLDPESVEPSERIEWSEVGIHEAHIAPWLKPPDGLATVYRAASKNVHFAHKPFVWRVYCKTCRREITYKPVVKYRTAENKAVHHNQSVHGTEYWSD